MLAKDIKVVWRNEKTSKISFRLEESESERDIKEAAELGLSMSEFYRYIRKEYYEKR